MSVTLQVNSGPSIGMRIHLVRGQIVNFGRTDWADYSFPTDSSMADVHFSVHTNGPQYRIRDISSGAGTLVNGAPIKESALHTGDMVLAGKTTFSVIVEGESTPVRHAVPADTVTETAAGPSPTPVHAAEFCRVLKMSDQAKELLLDDMEPAEYLRLLIESQLYTDGLRFLAFWLPKPTAVAWACECVEKTCGKELTPSDRTALSAAQQWAADPCEANRRSAEAAATASAYSGAASWLALSAFWSGGSLAGPELPTVPPGEALTAEAITGAFMLAATIKEPLEAAYRYQTYLIRGQQLISETINTSVKPQ